MHLDFMLYSLLTGVVLLCMVPHHMLSVIRTSAIALTLWALCASIQLWWYMDMSGHGMQMLVVFPRMHVQFGLDVLGLSLVVLTTALFPICMLLLRTGAGVLTFLLLEVLLLGALVVLDMLGFYMLFESTLMLLFLHIGRYAYGSLEAAYKIVMYTMVGSLVWLFSLQNMFGWTSCLGVAADSSLDSAAGSGISGWGLLIVFAVKMPLMPVHLWLPEAHVAAPTAGSVLLAGVLLKIGGLGFLRWMIPLVPGFSRSVLPLIACAAAITFVVCTLSTIRQIDLKKIVAYSSISHMSLVVLTALCISDMSAAAATAMMISHGIVSPALFMLVGMLYERTHTKLLLNMRGIGNSMPILSSAIFLANIANLGFPPFPNFMAEMLCLVCLYNVHELCAFVFCAGQVLGAVYGFWAYNRLVHGVQSQATALDICRGEVLSLVPIIFGVLWLSVAVN